MTRNDHNENEQNFWISYADLMAGLLFVFILLIGAILIKYVYLQNNFKSKDMELTKKTQIVSDVSTKLTDTQDTLRSTKTLLADEKEKNDNAKRMLMQKDEKLNSTNDKLEKLKDALFQIEQKLLNEQNANANLTKKLSMSGNEIIATKKELSKTTKKLQQSTLAHEKLIKDLNITRSRIKNLTGIRIQAIRALKKTLGSDIEVDPNSGSIRLSSSVLFDVDSSVLREEAKAQLSETLVNYISTLLNDEKIRSYIDDIIIEGYTDSQGSYMYNLILSQKRALSVLKYLYSLGEINEKLLNRYVNVSGRSYNNIIYKDGVEDKNASRRIEVKFDISNKKAIQEIESFLKSEHR